MSLVILFLIDSSCFGHYYVHHQVVSGLQAEAMLQPATQILHKPNHNQPPTHSKPRTIRPMW